MIKFSTWSLSLATPCEPNSYHIVARIPRVDLIRRVRRLYEGLKALFNIVEAWFISFNFDVCVI